MINKLVLLGTMGLAIMLLLNVAYAFSAKVTVPASHAVYLRHTVVPNDLKPAGCASINVTRIIIGSGTINGVSGVSSLILGSPGGDNITGGNIGDCILGGGGNDFIFGSGGTDVVYGGPGSDFLNAETCYAGPGNKSGDNDINFFCGTWYP